MPRDRSRPTAERAPRPPPRAAAGPCRSPPRTRPCPRRNGGRARARARRSAGGSRGGARSRSPRRSDRSTPACWRARTTCGGEVCPSRFRAACLAPQGLPSRRPRSARFALTRPERFALWATSPAGAGEVEEQLLHRWGGAGKRGILLFSLSRLRERVGVRAGLAERYAGALDSNSISAASNGLSTHLAPVSLTRAVTSGRGRRRW